MDRLTGRTLGPYRVLEQLGRGGMAEVYKAYQPSLDRYVALKILYAHLASDDTFVQRFEHEARAVARLQHPNILQVFEFGIEDNYYFMVMPFVDGSTLKKRLADQQGKMSPGEIVRIIGAVAEALHYAHSEGMVHRDIKSSNIMINKNGAVFLTDFGIAKMLESPQFTMTGSTVGTPEYMSPEQCLGDKVDGRSDIYSLGIVLYEMTVGRVPYTADTPYAVATAQLSKPLPLPTQINPDVPDVVEKVILKALAKKPEDRYQTAAEFARAVREVLPEWEAWETKTLAVPAQAAREQAELTPVAAAVSAERAMAATVSAPESASAPTAAAKPASSTQTAASQTLTGTKQQPAVTPEERQERVALAAKIALVAIGLTIMLCGSSLMFSGMFGVGGSVSALQSTTIFCLVPGLVLVAAAGMLHFRAEGVGLSPTFLASVALVGFAIFSLLCGATLLLSSPFGNLGSRAGSLAMGLLSIVLGIVSSTFGTILWFSERNKARTNPKPTVEEPAKPG